MQKAFESIIGYAGVKLELMRILDQLRYPEKYTALGVTDTHGLLLYGAPGVGKSTFALDFLNVTGRKTFICRKDKTNGDFVEEIVQTFDQAAEAAPSVILLDDLDKFANGDRRRRDTDEFVTVQTCIDRVKDKQVFVVATANDIDKLPESLTRAGRFDNVLKLECPRGKDAQDIVAHYLSKKAFVADMDVRRIGRLLNGRSCAELETVVNQAGIYAAFDGRQRVEMKDMIKSILRIIFEAPESFKEDLRTLPLIACHEAGHALAAELLEPDSVDLITVLNHDSQAAGVTAVSMDECYFHSHEMMEHRVMYLLAGKAATEICYGIVDPGVVADMRRAFAIVARFVGNYCSFGFDQFVYSNDSSDGLRDRRDSRIATELERYYAQVKKLLIANKDKLVALTDRLVKEKTLLGDQLQEILNCA
jgi:cell division protease FtsH